MHKARGATLVEMVFTLSLTAIVVMSTTLLYSFVAIRSGDSVTKYNVYQQSKDLMGAISESASNAISCSNVAIGSVIALKCVVPSTGTDRDRDGIIDRYEPAGVYKTLKEYYSPGKRIWYFPSTNPAAVGTAGKFWYRAVRNDDTTITSGDIDAKWSYLTGTTPRCYIPGGVTFAQSATTLSTTVQISIEPTTRTNSAVPGFSGNLGNSLPSITVNRRFFWRNAN